MNIQNHKLIDESGTISIEFQETPNQSGNFKQKLPDTIVLHYTAGSSLESSAKWLCNSKANASAHIIVGKNGDVVQLAPFNQIAWHAGKSKWKNRTGLNKYSIGIEIDNAGVLEKRADGKYYTWFNKEIENNKVVLAPHKHGEKGKAWEAFPKAQIERVEEICQLLKEAYDIQEIVGHEDIAPGRKKDPGPAFPLDNMRSKILLGRKEDEAGEKEYKQKGHPGIVTAEYLNIRIKPGIGAMKAAPPLPKGTKVIIKEQRAGWAYVQVATEGWVSSNWIKKNT